VKIIPEPSEHLKHVQGHKVKHCIAFKFGTEFHHVTGDMLQMSNVKGQRSRSHRKVKYQQQKRYNTAMDRFGDIKLGMAS